MTELLDGLAEMMGMALLLGGVVIGLPALGIGFVLGRLSKKGKDQSPT